MANTQPQGLIKPYKKANVLQITQGFHRQHEAIDIVSTYGTPLVAPETCRVVRIFGDGPITNSYKELEYGYGVRLRGLESGRHYLYWHTWPYLPVWSGDIVKAGQIIAFMGNSGNVFTGGNYVPLDLRAVSPYKGTHLHLEMFSAEGRPIDPAMNIDWFYEPIYSTSDWVKAVSATLLKIGKLAFR